MEGGRRCEVATSRLQQAAEAAGHTSHQAPVRCALMQEAWQTYLAVLKRPKNVRWSLVNCCARLESSRTACAVTIETKVYGINWFQFNRTAPQRARSVPARWACHRPRHRLLRPGHRTLPSTDGTRTVMTSLASIAPMSMLKSKAGWPEKSALSQSGMLQVAGGIG